MVMLNPKNQNQQAVDEARKIVSLNNSASAKVSDNLISVLEAGEGSVYLRDQLDHILHHLAPGGNWVQLRQLLSIKEKIAYVVGLQYAEQADTGALHATLGIANAASTAPVSLKHVKEKLDTVIHELETRLLNNQDFTESWILRHAAFNRFEAKFTDKERAEVTSLAGAVQKIAVDNGFDTIAETMHFQQESDAQKIIKISEAVAMMTQKGTVIDQKLMDRFEKMGEKIKPLRELDKHYKHQMNMLNLVHRTARKGYNAMITGEKQKKLFALLKEMDVADPTVYILDASKVDANGDPAYLDKELLTLKRKDPIRLKGLLKKYNMTEGDLENWFNSYFSYSSVERAKTDLDKQKQTTFGHRLKDYEHDINAWRGITKQRILDIHSTPAVPAVPANPAIGAPAVPAVPAVVRMIGNPLDFQNDYEFQFVNSYFDKFPDLFFANEEDERSGHFEQMRDIIAALIRRRVPALNTGDRRRFGSRLDGIIRTTGNARLIRRTHTNLDDSQMLAMIIMAQNEAKSSMFYTDKNPFETQ